MGVKRARHGKMARQDNDTQRAHNKQQQATTTIDNRLIRSPKTQYECEHDANNNKYCPPLTLQLNLDYYCGM